MSDHVISAQTFARTEPVYLRIGDGEEMHAGTITVPVTLIPDPDNEDALLAVSDVRPHIAEFLRGVARLIERDILNETEASEAAE